MNTPASPYLHDRLQARRANNPSRLRRSDSVPNRPQLDDDIFLKEAQSHGIPSFATPPSTRTNATITSSASLGAREMEKRMDRLSKLNFDLKMEIFHCRERMDKLQEECNAMESLAGKAKNLSEENATLLEINDSLVKELEHRDEAVQEAVAIICDLEEIIQRANGANQCETTISAQRTPPRLVMREPSTERALSLSTSQGPESRSKMATSLPKRVPSFIADRKASTRALRSVYLESTQTLHAVKSYASLMSQREDVEKSVSDGDSMHSPCLSVLSESSFPSIYNLPRAAAVAEQEPKHDQPALDNEKQFEPTPSKAGSDLGSASDNSSWIRVQTPQQSTSQMSFEHLHQPHSGSQQLKSVPHTVSDHGRKDRSLLGGLAFGGALLPPTPESVSTSVLQDSYMDHANVKTAHGLLASFDHHTTKQYSSQSSSTVVEDTVTDTRSRKRASPSDRVWSNRHSVSLSSTDEEDELEYRNSDAESINQDYPCGSSIDTGTPSRFQLRHATPPARDLLFNGESIARASRPKDHRRNTSAEIKHHVPQPARPGRQRMERSETTPNLSTSTRPSPMAIQKLARKSSLDNDAERQLLIDSGLLPEISVRKRLDDHPASISSSQRNRDIITTQNKAPTSQTITTKRQIDGNSRTSASTSGLREALSQKTHRLLRRHRDRNGRRSSDINPVSLKVHREAHNNLNDNATTSDYSRPSSSAVTRSCNWYMPQSKRPFSSGGEELLAVQAANQALKTEAVMKAATFSPGGGTRRGLFRRRDSVRR